MRIGLIARSDDRGLGNMTRDFYERMRPSVTVVIEVIGSKFENHSEEWYPGAPVVQWDPNVPKLQRGDLARVIEQFIECDVVYSAETFYDETIPDALRLVNVRTVLHSMPEFWRPSWPAPSAVWLPTSWIADMVPHSAIVPVPLPTPPPGVITSAGESPPRMLHIAGNRVAMHDRNGTAVFMRALQLVRKPVTVHVECQANNLPAHRSNRFVTYTRHTGGRADRWVMYAGSDVLVMPRRYGGLCLPVLEAAALGMPVIMPDVPPNGDAFPAVLFNAKPGRMLDVAPGRVQMWEPDPLALARMMEVVAHPVVYAHYRVWARAWALGQMWDALRPVYLAEFARVMGSRP